MTCIALACFGFHIFDILLINFISLVKMENAEEIFHFLEDFSKRKPKTIPQELNEYLAYVARTGDPVYHWPLVKCLFKEKLLNVITDFYETSPGIDIPLYPNVDPFNYDTLKNSLIERLDSFSSAPFTVQRICELLTYPRKQYNRVDKYMRAIEKNILVVSTREPGTHRHADAENGEPIVNGSDNNSEYNVDVEMEDMSWKETKEQTQIPEPQPSSSESYSIAEIEARLRAKQAFPTISEEKPAETFTSPQQSDQSKEKISDQKTSNFNADAVPSTSDSQNIETTNEPEKTDKMETDVKLDEPVLEPMPIPEIKINDTTINDSNSMDICKDVKLEEGEISDDKCATDNAKSNENILNPESKEIDTEVKVVPEVSEVSSSSEESSSSSDNTDGNSNSPKAVVTIEEQIEENESNKMETDKPESLDEPTNAAAEKSPPVLQSENYSITDVNSELPQISVNSDHESKSQELVEHKTEVPFVEKDSEEPKTETEAETKVENSDSTSSL